MDIFVSLYAMIRFALTRIGVSLFILSLAGNAARAEVYEVDQEGGVHSRTGAGAVTWQTGAGLTTPEGVADVPDVAIPNTALSPMVAPVAPSAFQEALLSIASSNDISPNLLEALIWQESRWRPGAHSPKGAYGLTQLMPGTARQMGVDPTNPVANMAGGARYLRIQLDRFGGNLELALAAYNSGPERVAKLGRIPNIRETQDYVTIIMARLAATNP